MAVLDDPPIATPYGPYAFVGGHRLWHAPEAFPRTYVPEVPPHITATSSQISIVAPTEAPTGVQKELSVSVMGEQLQVVHRLFNRGLWPIRLSAWALTQLPLGGEISLPLSRGAGLLPDRRVVFWPYTDVRDERLDLCNDAIRLRAQPGPPLKVGAFSSVGWIAYTRAGLRLTRSFTPVAGDYPDLGCNVETYCNDAFVELEVLGPLTTVEPGDGLEWVEHWDVSAV